MQNITHDTVEVRYNTWVTVWLYLPYSLPEGLQCSVVVVLLELSHPLEIIENHLIWVVLNGRTADSNYLIVVVCVPNILYKGYPCTRIIRFYLYCPFIDSSDVRLWQLEKRHVCSFKHIDVSILLGHSQGLREESQHLSTVWVIILLTACNNLTEQL